MRCAVYCFLPRRLEQLDSLVDRLQDAGVQTEDIAVVVRKGDDGGSAADDMTCWVSSLWQTSLWWPLSLYGWSGRLEPGEEAPDSAHEVIPLELYRARHPK